MFRLPKKATQENSKQVKVAQGTDEFVGNSDLYLQEALTEVDLPQYVEDFTKSLRELLEILSNQLALAELCIKKRRSWKRYQKLVNSKQIKKKPSLVRPSETPQINNEEYQAVKRTAGEGISVFDQGDFHLQAALIEAGFPQYVEDFTQSIRELLKNLSNQLALAESCLKDRVVWGRYQALVQSRREYRRKHLR